VTSRFLPAQRLDSGLRRAVDRLPCGGASPTRKSCAHSLAVPAPPEKLLAVRWRRAMICSLRRPGRGPERWVPGPPAWRWRPWPNLLH